MKNSKRIHKVVLKRMFDDSPDTSWLGEYSDTRSSEFSIDRAHGEDCQTVTREVCKENIAATHNIDLAYARETEGTCADCGAVPDDCGKEVCKYWEPDCDCGRGDWSHREYRYFNPSLNYVGKDGKLNKEYRDDPNGAAEVRKYVKQDYERMEGLNSGQWCFVGVRADAQVSFGKVNGDSYLLQDVTSGGLWGIESDSGDYFKEVEAEQLSELRAQLHQIGFSNRAISAAFRNVERKED